MEKRRVRIINTVVIIIGKKHESLIIGITTPIAYLSFFASSYMFQYRDHFSIIITAFTSTISPHRYTLAFVCCLRLQPVNRLRMAEPSIAQKARVR